MRLVLGLVWLLRLLPLPLLAPLGQGLGMVLHLLARGRRHIAATNVRLCFPHLDEAARRRMVRRHFRHFGRSVLERGLLWWSRPARIRRLVRLTGMEHLTALQGRPVVIFGLHFVSMDVGWTRLTLEPLRLAGFYARQKNPAAEAVFWRGRVRFGNPVALSRQDGIRAAVRAMRDGCPFYYLPDHDFGPRDAVFAPFFGVPAATVTALSRLARLTGAAVVPCVTRMLPGGKGYCVELHRAWENYPGESVDADTRRMNEFVEEQVRRMPEQYFWVHKRFKTRPPGEPKVY
ncbi:MAG: lipid A biosynthesis acyltransferase [Betaproteobacteria bacterium]|nr:lipid A biosynthesis acyltransferase [Betaproteobacteria bacterium]